MPEINAMMMMMIHESCCTLQTAMHTVPITVLHGIVCLRGSAGDCTACDGVTCLEAPCFLGVGPRTQIMGVGLIQVNAHSVTLHDGKRPNRAECLMSNIAPRCSLISSFQKRFKANLTSVLNESAGSYRLHYTGLLTDRKHDILKVEFISMRIV